MRHPKSITITTAIAALVILTSISFSYASQTGMNGIHKHALVKHRVRTKHPNVSSRTFAKPEMEEEREAAAPDDSLWFRRHKDPATGTIPTGLYTSWYKSDQDHALSRAGHDGTLSTGDPLDTVACLGPFTQGGRTRALLVSAADATNHTFFAGSVSGGLWKSTNAGSSWTPVNDQAVNLAVTCITQSPLNSNNIYYATGESRGYSGENHGAYPGAGVFKSTDGGNTFQQLSATASTSNYSWAIEHDKADGLTVYWGTVSAGLRRTTDGGTTWSLASGTSGEICDIVTFSSGSVLIAKSGGGLYSTTNGKTGTFTQITSSAFPSSFARIRLAQCRNTPNTVYAAFANSNGSLGLIGLCKSTDGGGTWAAVTLPSIGSTQYNYNMMLGVDPKNSDSVVCGLQSLAYSSDGGTTWSGLGESHGDNHAYASFNGGSTQFLLGSDGGVDLHNWDSINWAIHQVAINNNYTTTQFVGGGFAGNGRKCAGGTQDNGNWRFRPGDTILALWGPGDGTYAYISQQDSNLAYNAGSSSAAETKYTQFFATDDNYQLQLHSEGIGPSIGSQGVNFYNFYQCNYADPLQLYVRTNAALWRTIDTGHSWTQLNTTSITGIDFIGCTSLVNPSVYFTTNVSGQNDHFYRIANAKTFTPGAPTDLSASIPSAVLTASFGEIAQTPSGGTSTSLLMCTLNYSSIPHIYKVTNASGSTPTWTNITGDLPSTLAVNEVQADPQDPNVLFAATDYGLYYSTNGGTNWIKEPSVPNTVISEMQLRSSDHKLFLFTYGRGVWYCSIKSGLTGIVQQASVEAAQPVSEFQFSLYPTPATSKLNVTLKDDLSSSARMVIYDMTGHMVSGNLWNASSGEEQEADISKLASGVYFLQIQDGDKISTQKFEKM